MEEKRKVHGDITMMKIVLGPSTIQVRKFRNDFEEETWETWENED